MQEQTNNSGQKLQKIEPKIGFTFNANGKKYTIEDALSIARAIEASKLELEMFDVSVNNIKNTLAQAYRDLNGDNPEKTIKYADAAVKIHNLISRVDKGFKLEENPVLRYAALFVNYENEDRRTISEESIRNKIQDWNEEGIEASGFFLLVLNVLPSVKKEFASLMANMSAKAGETADSQNQQKSDT